MAVPRARGARGLPEDGETMKDKYTIRNSSFGELVQVAEALNRSEAALQERYKRLAEQANELLPRRDNSNMVHRKDKHEHQDRSRL
jgi:hypothetical protein